MFHFWPKTDPNLDLPFWGSLLMTSLCKSLKKSRLFGVNVGLKGIYKGFYKGLGFRVFRGSLKGSTKFPYGFRVEGFGVFRDSLKGSPRASIGSIYGWFLEVRQGI